LQDDPAALVRASGPPGDLGQGLENPFGGERVRQVQTDIRQHNPDQGYIGQVESLGQHLRANQHVGFAVGKMGQDDVVSVFLAGGFPVPAQRDGLWEQAQHLALNLFAAQTKCADVRAFALRTGFGHLAAVPAAVAMQTRIKSLVE